MITFISRLSLLAIIIQIINGIDINIPSPHIPQIPDPHIPSPHIPSPHIPDPHVPDIQIPSPMGNIDQIVDFCIWPSPYSLSKINPEFRVCIRGKNLTIAVSSDDDIRSMVNRLIQQNFIKSRILFVIHGFQSTISEPWLAKTATALLNAEDSTVFIVGWGKGAKIFDYLQAASNTQTVAGAIALIVKSIKDSKSIYTYCIGHSLGAHTCGQAGRSGKLDRISGLDPAGPSFQDCPKHHGLNNADANCVDVIHTNGGKTGFGTLQPLGHVDFYPNCGQEQPGCNDVADVGCSHDRAYDYFIQTIAAVSSNKPAQLPAAPQGPCSDKFTSSCNACQNCEQTDCKRDQTASQAMGYGSICQNGARPLCNNLSRNNSFGLWFVPVGDKGFDSFCRLM